MGDKRGEERGASDRAPSYVKVPGVTWGFTAADSSVRKARGRACDAGPEWKGPEAAAVTDGEVRVHAEPGEPRPASTPSLVPGPREPGSVLSHPDGLRPTGADKGTAQPPTSLASSHGLVSVTVNVIPNMETPQRGQEPTGAPDLAVTSPPKCSCVSLVTRTLFLRRGQ